MTAPGEHIGPYRIVSKIGEGGMGEVYRAHDAKLGRDVAIKVLPDALAQDPDRRARFEREARLLAALHHPHIATIFGVEDSGPVVGLVMELVDGPTLTERIARKPMAVKEALSLARQIADALDAAHEKGIVHRDLKPENIKITKDGSVKVLDFGLATAVAGAGGEQSTIATQLVSQAGSIVGTAAYMSPEQARGEAVDKRTDIWAFGCVLFEMLTGAPAFSGRTASDVMANVLQQEPAWNTLPASTPPRVRELLRRCLQKDLRARLRDVADARADLAMSADSDRVIAGNSPRMRPVWVAAIVVLAVALVVVLFNRRQGPAPAAQTRVDIATPPTLDPVSMAISPDGRHIAFVADSEGRSRLWVRALDAAAAQLLAGTDNASYPFWSPDGRSLGFFSDGRQLNRVDLETGSVRRLTTVALAGGGTWSGDGNILFTYSPGTPIFRIPANGGAAVPATQLARQHTGHGFPQFLPDDRHFLFHVKGTPETRGVYLGRLDSFEIRRVVDADSPAIFAAPGHLLFVRQGALLSQPFDPDTAALSGTATPIVDHVISDNRQVPAASASRTGTVIYRAGTWRAARQFVWIDRGGRELGRVGGPDLGYPIAPALAPDGRRLAMHRLAGGTSGDVWLLDVTRAVLSRSTTHPAQDIFPTWSPDGGRIVFGSNRDGSYDLYVMPAGGGPEERVFAPEGAGTASHTRIPTDWSRTGYVLYNDIGPDGAGVWAAMLDATHRAFPVIASSAFGVRDGQFSPDGAWVAFQSNESGRGEVYVQPFPGPGPKVQVSNTGGAQVRWRGDGRELFYLALDGKLMSVVLGAASKTDALNVAAPVPLFVTHIGGAIQSMDRAQYAVSPDGQRFLMNDIVDEAFPAISVILNWSPAR